MSGAEEFSHALRMLRLAAKACAAACERPAGLSGALSVAGLVQNPLALSSTPNRLKQGYPGCVKLRRDVVRDESQKIKNKENNDPVQRLGENVKVDDVVQLNLRRTCCAGPKYLQGVPSPTRP